MSISLTKEEISSIVSGKHDVKKCKVVSNKPCDDNVHNFIIFKIDSIYYSFSYLFKANGDYNFPADFDNIDNNIVIVDVSVIDPPEPEPVLTPAQKEDKILCEKYRNTEVKPFTKISDFKLPKKVVDKAIEELSSKPFNMLDLRKEIYPICIEYGIEQKSFWNYFQKKLSSAMRKKAK